MREIFGTLVQFGDGAKVLKVSLPSDFSAVHLTLLPIGSSPQSVAEILALLGFTVPVECVRMSPQKDTATHDSATIRVEDRLFAKRLCAKLDSNRATSRVRPQINAVPINIPILHGSSFRRVDCKKVHCSWHRPFRTVWLNFGNQDIAGKVKDRFNAGAYKVVGQQVKASGPNGGGSYYNRLAWSVMLTDVPPKATGADITRDIPAAIRPRHVELGKASYEMDMDTANAMIKSKLEQIGSLEWWEDATESGGRRAKARARFLEEEDARKAVESLHETLLPFNRNGKLSVQLVHSAKVKVWERIYEAVQLQIGTERHIWEAQHLVFIPYEPVRGYRLLRLEGGNSTDVARAKNTLEKILAGEVAMHENKNLWISSFGVNGDALRRLKTIEQSLGILIVRNKRQSRLDLYGPPEKCKEAQTLLADLAKEILSTGHVIDLDQQRFFWACDGGFKKISAALGDGVVAFDIISTPKRILVNGSDEDYKLALSMINDQKETDEVEEEEEVMTESDCAICWTEAENPVRTHCEHTYCADCFERFSFSGATLTSTEESPIRCEGDSSKCKTVIPLSSLQDHLSSTTFEDLLEASFTSYIRRHPQTFRSCPTPNCSQIYRVTTSSPTNNNNSSSTSSSTSNIFTCPSCLASICTSCHISHQGLSCTQHRLRSSEDYQASEKMKKQLGFKDCPRCETTMEKTDGCDHIICSGCGIHICWNCMRTFNESALCYVHMNREHGGIGVMVRDDDAN